LHGGDYFFEADSSGAEYSPAEFGGHGSYDNSVFWSATPTCLGGKA
jgi:hypothetical protein